jgi:hypothetical protein
MAVAPGPATVNDVLLMVLAAIAALKATVICLSPTGTAATPHPGDVDTTVGAGGGAVVKPHVKLAAIGVPLADFAAVLTVTVIRVL